MLTNDTKLVVRLPQADKRRIKGLAATQGLTLGQAIRQAFEAWAEKLQSGGARPLDPRPSARADTDYEKPGQPKRDSQVSAQKQGANLGHPATPKQGRRPAKGDPPSTPGDGNVPNLTAPSRAGSAGRRSWIGQNVRRRRGCREKPATSGWLAELACHCLPS